MFEYNKKKKKKKNRIGAKTAIFLPGVDRHSTGYRVPDAGAGARVSRFHNDKGPLFQSDHSEVLGIIQWLQEGAITWPRMVTQTQVAVLPPANLNGSNGKFGSFNTHLLLKHFTYHSQPPMSSQVYIWKYKTAGATGSNTLSPDVMSVPIM